MPVNEIYQKLYTGGGDVNKGGPGKSGEKRKITQPGAN